MMSNNNNHIYVENDKLGLKDPRNRTVLFAVYEAIDFIDVNTPIRICRDGKWGLMDFRGNTVVEAMYSSMHSPYNGMIAVENNGKYGFIDYKGNVVIPLIYDSVEHFASAEECFGVPSVWVEKDGRYGAINNKGEVIIPFEYDDARQMKGFTIVGNGKLCGVVNFKNEYIVPMTECYIDFLADDIVGIYPEDSKGDMISIVNLTTRERCDCSSMGISDISDYGFVDGYAVVNRGSVKNIIDRQFHLLLPEWHDEIVMLEKGQVLISDKDSWQLYDKIGDKGMLCQYDDDYVYLPDGKTMYCRNQHNDTISVEPGITNLAYLAADDDDEKAKYQMNLYQKTVKFKEGVTKIGSGWEGISSDYSFVRKPEIDIYLPSTLNKVHPEAFLGILSRIRNVYVPYGMSYSMYLILPPYLRPLIKEESRRVKDIISDIRKSGFMRTPLNYILDIDERFEKRLPKAIARLVLYLLTILVMIPIMIGFFAAKDTILPIESIVKTTFISIGIIAAILPAFIIEMRKMIIGYIFRYIYCMLGWVATLCIIVGFVYFALFGANKYIGGEKSQYTSGVAQDFTRHESRSSHYYTMDVYVSKFNRIYDVRIPDLNEFYIGKIYNVKYHKGLFGLYVFDDAE